jgi:cell division protein FtsW
LAEHHGPVRHPRDVTPALLVAGIAILLVASQPDLGTSLVMTATLVAMLVAAGLPLRHLAGAGAAIAGLVTIYALSADYRRDRLMTFLDPWDHAADAGFQAVQGQIALGSGGLFCRGLGQSLQKNLFLPEAHTDFILAIVGEEWGVVGILVLVFLYGLVAYSGLRVAQRASGAYAKLLAAGITSLILCQATLNMFAILGLAPLTGVPLPFISYGSTNLVVLLGGVGLLLNVARGGSAHLRAVPARPDRAGSRDGRDVRDRGRRDGRSRRAGAGGRRRATG